MRRYALKRYSPYIFLDMISQSDIMIRMNRKHRQTLERIFEKPERSDILWSDIEGLFLALGAEIFEGKGSRVRVLLSGVRAVFHRPHPQRVTNKSTIRSVCRFLKESGVR
ncbi:MAG: type II toxin-antitoxin system HicA family toxin [Desulfovermiculus sp.]